MYRYVLVVLDHANLGPGKMDFIGKPFQFSVRRFCLRATKEKELIEEGGDTSGSFPNRSRLLLVHLFE